MLEKRLYSDPPPAYGRIHDKPTLLVSWWCTAFSVTIILVRVCGRKVRANKLFPEDQVMLLSMIPLLIRMALVHLILLWGTNNAQTQGLSKSDIHFREIGSRLVLASRIFYAMFIWTAKFTVSEFLKRLTGQFWRKSYEWGLRFIRVFLLATFVAVFIATLTECQPFDHYWQVIPDPGPKCRQGYAQLITMGACDIVTDLLLVVFPIPIILTSAMPTKRKVSLTLLFSMSLILIGITGYRVPAVIARDSNQQFRSLIASLEILAATGVSNAIVIGSFIRDRGVKKQKYRVGSFGSTLDRTPTRRTTITQHHWGSDADLVGDIGMRLDPALQSRINSIPRPPPMPGVVQRAEATEVDKSWTFASGARQDMDEESLDTDSSSSTAKKDPGGDIKKSASAPAALDSKGATDPPESLPNSPGKLSFFDVGGLMGSDTPPPPSSRQSSSLSTVLTHDFATQSPPSQTSRRGSRALLQDIGGLLGPHYEESPPRHPSPSNQNSQQSPPPLVRNFSRGGMYSRPRHGSRQQTHDESESPTPPYRAEPDVSGPTQTQTGGHMMELVDVGGLLR